MLPLSTVVVVFIGSLTLASDGDSLNPLRRQCWSPIEYPTWVYIHNAAVYSFEREIIPIQLTEQAYHPYDVLQPGFMQRKTTVGPTSSARGFFVP